MPLDNGTSTFADIDRPVNSAVPSKAFYFQRSMDLQYHALRIASWDPYFEEYLQALVEHVYIQYLPYNNFLSQDRDIWRIANTDYSFWFSTFDLGHLRTRDPESGKLSTFFNIPMHLAVIGHMGEETSYKPSSAVGVRVPDGALVAYSVHKKSEFPTSSPSPTSTPTAPNFDRLHLSPFFPQMAKMDDEDFLLTVVTPLILEIKAEDHPLTEGWIQLCGYSLSSFQACRCRWGLFQRGGMFGRLMVLGEVNEEGIAIEYRDPTRDSKDDGDDDEPPKVLKNVDEFELFLKSPRGTGTLPHRLFTNSTLSADGDLDPIGVKVAHATIQMGIDLIKTLPIDRPLGRLPDPPDSDLLSSINVCLRDMINNDETNQHLVHPFQHLSFQNEAASATIQEEAVDKTDMEKEGRVQELCNGADEEDSSDCCESYESDSYMSIDEEESEQEWWTMGRVEKDLLKEKGDKAYVEAMCKVLRDKGTPFFLLSPSQFDKLSS